VDFSLPAERVVRSLNRIIEWRESPLVIRVDKDRLKALERLHSAIGYVPPQEAEEAFYGTLNTDKKAACHLNK
jgi:hypothetical protein